MVRAVHVQRRLAGTTVILLRHDDRILDLAQRRIMGNGELDRVQRIVMQDRTDAKTIWRSSGVLDLVFIVEVSAVTDENRAGDLLVQHETHLSLEPGNGVHGGDVHQVIAVELLLLVDGRRTGRTLQQREDLFLLAGAGDVTKGSSLFAGDVGVHRLDPGERTMGGSGKHAGDPLDLASDERRGVGNRLGVREQDIDVVDTVGRGVCEDGLLQGAELVRTSENAGFLAVRQRLLGLDRLDIRLIGEQVAGHVVTFLVVRDVVIVIILLLDFLIPAVLREIDEVVHDVLLLF